jgi:hypothetical protein
MLVVYYPHVLMVPDVWQNILETTTAHKICFQKMKPFADDTEWQGYTTTTPFSNRNARVRDQRRVYPMWLTKLVYLLKTRFQHFWRGIPPWYSRCWLLPGNILHRSDLRPTIQLCHFHPGMSLSRCSVARQSSLDPLRHLWCFRIGNCTSSWRNSSRNLLLFCPSWVGSSTAGSQVCTVSQAILFKCCREFLQLHEQCTDDVVI